MIGYTLNRIPEEARIFTSGVSSIYWKSPSIPGTIPSTRTEERHPGVGSMALQVNTGFTITYNLNPATQTAATNESRTTIDDRGLGLEAFIWVKSTAPITVRLELDLHHISINETISGTPQQVYVDSGDWVLVRANGITVPPDNHNYGAVLHFDVINAFPSTTIYLSFPCIYGQLDFINNPGAYDILNRLPGYLKQTVPLGEAPTYALARYTELLAGAYGDVVEKIFNFAYADVSEGFRFDDATSKSQLVDPTVIPLEYAGWLAQFTGTELSLPSVSSTPWGNLGDTWEEIDAIDTVTTPEDSVVWSSLQEFNPIPVGIEEFIRWQIEYGYYGFAAGSREAIQKSLERVLTGTKGIQWDTTQMDEFILTVRTLRSETPGATVLITDGNPVPEMQEILDAVRPLGIIVQHQLATTF